MQKKRRLLPTYEIWMKVLRLPRYDPEGLLVLNCGVVLFVVGGELRT